MQPAVENKIIPNQGSPKGGLMAERVRRCFSTCLLGLFLSLFLPIFSLILWQSLSLSDYHSQKGSLSTFHLTCFLLNYLFCLSLQILFLLSLSLSTSMAFSQFQFTFRCSHLENVFIRSDLQYCADVLIHQCGFSLGKIRDWLYRLTIIKILYGISMDKYNILRKLYLQTVTLFLMWNLSKELHRIYRKKRE